MLCEPGHIKQARIELTPADFVGQGSVELYNIMCEISEESPHIGAGDLWSLVIRELCNRGIKSSLADASREVSELSEMCGIDSMFQHNVALVQEQRRLREIGYIAAKITIAAHERDADQVRALQGQLVGLKEGARLADAITMTEAGLSHAAWFKRLEGGELAKYPTGMSIFDKEVNGLYDGGMMAGQCGIIAGRSGFGKTTIITWLAAQIAKKDPDQRVHIFSLELTPEHIASKCLQMQIKTDKIRATPRSDQAAQAAYAMSSWADRLTISEERTPRHIFSRARKMRDRGVSLFVVDHLHRIKLTDTRGGSARFEYGEFVRDITDQAKDQSALWLLAAQMNRKHITESRPPVLTDIAESDQVCGNTDFAIGIHYPQPQQRNKLELRVLKNRWGNPNYTETVRVDWEHQTLSRWH